ncbi:MAG: 3-dehydroquinate synthase [Polyangiaceae bacterium UTPRO1]|jgi:3-dehydroquinate synthase|nr:3-dehydroquinate synthase [Myxococcales bacterium]OQY67742.1 MAG: 3-dehydroquinate synthase [Polyangiaceae bacterium UTPRO1]
MEIVNVELGDRAYPIYVGAGCLEDLGPRLAQTGGEKRMAVVTNSTVASLYLEPVTRTLTGAGFDPAVVQIPDGEEHKNLAWLAFVYDRLIDAGVDRGGSVVALGGGVVGDLAGFAAATYLRGIDLVQVPTTLLAQIDSSIGGKTGVNHPAGKNLLGAFKQPRFVLADVECLRTLPRREYVAGLAEVVKTGAILDAELFALLEAELPDILRQERDLLVRVVRRCCQLKALVVAEDETEGGYRAILNFGHTLGHAIESLTDYTTFLHGEAVAIGMVAAARVSQQLGFCDATTVRRLSTLVDRCGLPTEVPSDLEREALALAMRTDKKALGGSIKFVCLEGIGRTRFERLGCDEIVRYI